MHICILSVINYHIYIVKFVKLGNLVFSKAEVFSIFNVYLRWERYSKKSMVSIFWLFNFSLYIKCLHIKYNSLWQYHHRYLLENRKELILVYWDNLLY